MSFLIFDYIFFLVVDFCRFTSLSSSYSRFLLYMYMKRGHISFLYPTLARFSLLSFSLSISLSVDHHNLLFVICVRKEVSK